MIYLINNETFFEKTKIHSSHLGVLPDESRFADLPYYKNGPFVIPFCLLCCFWYGDWHGNDIVGAVVQRFLATVYLCVQNLRYLSWKNTQKNDHTFTLKIHRLYATKNKGSDITSDPLSFLYFVP